MCRIVSEGGLEPGGPVLPGGAHGQARTLCILSHALCQVISEIKASKYGLPIMCQNECVQKMLD